MRKRIFAAICVLTAWGRSVRRILVLPRLSAIVPHCVTGFTQRGAKRVQIKIFPAICVFATLGAGTASAQGPGLSAPLPAINVYTFGAKADAQVSTLY